MIGDSFKVKEDSILFLNFIFFIKITQYEHLTFEISLPGGIYLKKRIPDPHLWYQRK